MALPALVVSWLILHYVERDHKSLLGFSNLGANLRPKMLPDRDFLLFGLEYVLPVMIRDIRLLSRSNVHRFSPYLLVLFNLHPQVVDMHPIQSARFRGAPKVVVLATLELILCPYMVLSVVT